MSLPAAWVDKIFLKLTLTFGRDFLSRWEGVPIEDVKADWAHELRGFQQNPASIAYGLEHCITGKPPTVQEFKSACSRKPDSTPLLPSPVVDPVIAARVLEGLRESAKPKPSMKDWAYRLKGRHEAGDKLNRNQIACYQAAIGETSCAT